MANELNCDYCGKSNAKVIADITLTQVYSCVECACGARGPFFVADKDSAAEIMTAREAAIAAWNRRADGDGYRRGVKDCVDIACGYRDTEQSDEVFHMLRDMLDALPEPPRGDGK